MSTVLAAVADATLCAVHPPWPARVAMFPVSDVPEPAGSTVRMRQWPASAIATSRGLFGMPTTTAEGSTDALVAGPPSPIWIPPPAIVWTSRSADAGTAHMRRAAAASTPAADRGRAHMRPVSAGASASGSFLEAELARVAARVVLAPLEDLPDVVAGLGIRNVGLRVERIGTARVAHPVVHVAEARVVRGDRQRLAAVVAVQEPSQVPGAVGDVDLGRAEILERETDPAGLLRDEARRVGSDLHEATRAGDRGAVAELRLLVDDRRDQRGIEVLVVGLLADDVLVPQRQGDLLHGVLEGMQPDDQHQRGQARKRDREPQPAAAHLGTPVCRARAALTRCGASRSHPRSGSQALPTAWSGARQRSRRYGPRSPLFAPFRPVSAGGRCALRRARGRARPRAPHGRSRQRSRRSSCRTQLPSPTRTAVAPPRRPPVHPPPTRGTPQPSGRRAATGFPRARSVCPDRRTRARRWRSGRSGHRGPFLARAPRPADHAPRRWPAARA